MSIKIYNIVYGIIIIRYCDKKKKAVADEFYD